MFQSLVADFLIVDRALMWKDVPNDKRGNYDYVVDQLDWEANIDPAFKEHHFLEPRPLCDPMDMHGEGYHENWITYGNPYFSAKELTVYPGRSVSIRDAEAYGILCIQGYGRFGTFQISSPSLIRFGEITEDEFFITVGAAREGVTITNLSTHEPLVMLKHFNAGNPEMPQM